MKRPYAVWILVAVTVLAIGGYLYMLAGPTHKSVGLPEKITIAYSCTPDSAVAQIAQTQGYYLQEGLEAVPQMYSYGKMALKAVLEGKADFATVAETPVMFAIMKDEKISIIATIVTSRKNNAIIARRDKGILAPKDLRGRKIAATFGTISEFYMDAFLIMQSISRKEMKVMNLKPEELVNALSNGEVDAVSAFAPFSVQAQQKLGSRGIIFHNEDIYTQTFNVVATREYIRKNPDRIKSLLRGLIKAEEFIARHPAEAQTIVADFSRMDKALVSEIWTDENFGVTLDQSLLLAMEDESRWAIKEGLADRTTVPDYLNYIYIEGLESVKPKAVRILR
jgi:sulfonate transport system substrate-binding protein